ncbi:AP2-associated protein kinase 1 [Orchesella cincta]|uniref:non-specific serine/threonine protein kinase n=1 Tax=Orchesella cincta TaxID=48709 RepID=A0A1D2MTA4_ORCCI|nr:AP2-associated protein kinase 1 [Orchesella cincta]
MSTPNNISPRSTSPPPMKVVSQKGEPPHYSALIGKTLSVGSSSVAVEEVIAEGGFGVIFLVKGVADKTKYALKRVVVNNERDYASVISEVEIMSTLGHSTPHILWLVAHAIVQYSTSDYTREIQNLMPLCKQNVHALASSRIAKSANFTEQEVIQILSHVSAGLQYLHSRSPPIIHRDIKIENILLLEDTYVLSDFGSSTTKTWDPATDTIVSIQEDLDKYTTLVYRSPEMVDLYGNRGPITINSDIWALGCCGYKMMSFKDPFDTILAIQNRNLSWNIKVKYSDNLVHLIECLLAENQNTRPGIQEVIALLSSVSSGEASLVNRVYSKILEAKKEADGVVKSRTPGAVVLETSVTPRQRPKRNAQLVSVPSAVIPARLNHRNLSAPARGSWHPPLRIPGFSGAGPGAVPVPPASPQSNKATPSPQPVATAPPCSWNPFDEDYAVARPQFCDNECVTPKQEDPDNEEDDPFARAPFEDYFKYQPIMVNANEPERSQPSESLPEWYAPNNPFLNYINVDNSHSNNAADNRSTGLTNLSFNDNNDNQ